MTETLKLPVLPLSDSVVLPGMVVPVRLDEPEIQAAVDAAQSVDRKVLVVPRLDGKYAADRHGRRPRAGRQAAQRREGCRRARRGPRADRVRRHRAGRGAVGGGHPVADQPVTGRMTELAKEYKALVVGILQQRGAWQVIDSVQQITDPGQLADTAGWASYIDIEHKAQLLAETDVRQAARAARRVDARRTSPSRRSPRRSPTTSARAWRRPSASSCCASSWPRSARSWARASRRAPTTTAPGWRPPNLPEHVRKAALAEVGKLERASDQSPEAGWIRTWLDTVLDIPWNERTTDADDLVAARAILDADHAGPRRRQGAADRVPGRPVAS